MFDALLLASYGGPERIEEIEPFLDKILLGKRVPEARRQAIVERYKRFNGVSPLPAECRRFLEELQDEATRQNLSLRTYWGNLYAAPTFDQAFEQMERDGVKNALVFSTSAFGSPQSCQRYRAEVVAAFQKRSSQCQSDLKLSFVPPCFDLPAIRRSVADDLLTALAWEELESAELFTAPEPQNGPTKLILFTAHSIPTSDGERSAYKSQLLSVASSVLSSIVDAPAFGGPIRDDVDSIDASLNGFPRKKICLDNEVDAFLPETKEKLREKGVDAALVFQSRSGSPRIPWLEPDAVDYLRQYKQKEPQLKNVIVSPIGFFFENMETIYDLDVELRETCLELGLTYRRTTCVGASSRLVDAVVKLTRLSHDDLPNCDRTAETCDLSCRR